MAELKLYGMKAAFDEIMAAAVKRQHEPQRIFGDLLKAEIAFCSVGPPPSCSWSHAEVSLPTEADDGSIDVQFTCRACDDSELGATTEARIDDVTVLGAPLGK